MFNAVGDSAVEALRGEVEKATDKFWAEEAGRQASIAEFHAILTTLTAPDAQGAVTPLIVVIDELDRCRPDYALEIIEVIKHFFAVSHVHFVLGVNLHALENSVKARYGPEIDASAYLQKFLSFTLSLPDHIGDQVRTRSIIAYAKTIGSKMDTPPVILKEACEQLNVLAETNNISIRDVGKIFSAMSLLPEVIQHRTTAAAHRSVTITLIITKIIRPDLFPRLLKVSINEPELITYFGAFEDNITRNLNNNRWNPKFNQNTLILFAIWRFICKDGIMESPEGWPDIAKWFDQFGSPDDVRGITQYVSENWLNDYNIP